MIKNYFKAAWRNILNNKLTSFINIFGLAIGISCSLLIWFWVKDENSYNGYIPDAAVIEDIPYNSTLKFDWLINFKVTEADWMKQWGNISFPTYLKLKPNTSATAAAATMRSIYPENAPEGFKYNYPILQPLKDVYLYSKYENGKPAGGRIEYVRIFALIAIFILTIACMNFMNLATARASLGAKEIGVRKVSGASRASLIKQFITESILICTVATSVAVFIVWIALPAFNVLFDKEIHLDALAPSLWISIIVLTIITAIVAGSYPALLLSSFKPVRILKGNATVAGGGTNVIRKGLVVFQFALSAFLMVGMLVVAKQMHYIQTKNLGFDKEHLIYVHLDGELYKKVETYQNELNRLPGVVASNPINALPMNLNSTSGDLSWPGKAEDLQSSTTATWTGYDFAKTMGIPLVAGRDFSNSYPCDSISYVINESAAKMMNMKNPVGQQVIFWKGKGTIIGVLQDFHMTSIHSPITPLILTLAPQNVEYMLIRLKAGNMHQTIADIGKLTRSFNPGYPYEYHFADETYEAMYKNEMQVSALVKYFGALAIVISCLGLFGMVTLNTEQRYREIGIRKVLGASVSGIVGLLSEESLKIISVAMLVAFPLAYWASSNWLSTFHYKISLGIGVFFLAAIVLLVVSLITISFQSIKAAMANPVKSLPTE